ncbi:hypothetical protein PDJ85_26985 [Bacillus cereus group sp. TH260-2LC]|uniref:hypothetical protein n=1 Tax=Bacillus cereus group TaxID=86661 RepID=UPI0011A96AC7|nr:MULTISPECIES: hypothetical protein [Bacillus cereus group]MDA1531991.1 hypothetical protein [Bacillus cereus group sp. TH260-2LC]
MEIRITDWLIGLASGYYLVPTIVIFGMTIHWVLVALCLVYAYRGLKKLGKFLWTKFVAAVVKELQNDNNFKG